MIISSDEERKEFLHNQPIIKKIESVTGLNYRKTITVADWPGGESKGVMIEGQIKLPDVSLPLDVEGCLRNTKYVGWAKFFQEVLTQDELTDFLERKKQLRGDKKAYKALKEEMRRLVVGRCVERGLVAPPTEE